jgi:2-amino-4-hydroxy-6-hydroxymethyldihydropteridine diphosphokinase
VPWVWVSLGSNLDRDASLRGAVRRLRAVAGDPVLSSVYESAAVGAAGPPFYNLVAGFETDLGVAAINDWLRAIETAFGRERGADKNAPRTLDLDLLTYGERVGVIDGYALPRADILQYAFVLAPLAEVAPHERHPFDGRTYAELWAVFPQAEQPLERVAFSFD